MYSTIDRSKSAPSTSDMPVPEGHVFYPAWPLTTLKYKALIFSIYPLEYVPMFRHFYSEVTYPNFITNRHLLCHYTLNSTQLSNHERNVDQADGRLD